MPSSVARWLLGGRPYENMIGMDVCSAIIHAFLAAGDAGRARVSGVKGPKPRRWLLDVYLHTSCHEIHGIFALECAPGSDFVTRGMQVCVKVVVARFGKRGVCVARSYQTEERCRSAVKE